jgi:hypothetical protein
MIYPAELTELTTGLRVALAGSTFRQARPHRREGLEGGVVATGFY